MLVVLYDMLPPIYTVSNGHDANSGDEPFDPSVRMVLRSAMLTFFRAVQPLNT